MDDRSSFFGCVWSVYRNRHSDCDSSDPSLFLKRRLVIRMPAEVPPAVAKSFSVLLPGAAIITGAWVIRVLLEFNVNQFVQAIFSPLAVGLNTLPGMLLYTF